MSPISLSFSPYCALALATVPYRLISDVPSITLSFLCPVSTGIVLLWTVCFHRLHTLYDYIPPGAFLERLSTIVSYSIQCLTIILLRDSRSFDHKFPSGAVTRDRCMIILKI